MNRRDITPPSRDISSALVSDELRTRPGMKRLPLETYVQMPLRLPFFINNVAFSIPKRMIHRQTTQYCILTAVYLLLVLP